MQNNHDKFKRQCEPVLILMLMGNHEPSCISSNTQVDQTNINEVLLMISSVQQIRSFHINTGQVENSIQLVFLHIDS